MCFKEIFQNSRYVIFYLPFDFGYKALKFLPVKMGCEALKEVYRAKQVHDGVGHAAKLFPNAYLGINNYYTSKLITNSETTKPEFSRIIYLTNIIVVFFFYKNKQFRNYKSLLFMNFITNLIFFTKTNQWQIGQQKWQTIF